MSISFMHSESQLTYLDIYIDNIDIKFFWWRILSDDLDFPDKALARIFAGEHFILPTYPPEV